MARKPRKKSDTGMYHIMLRGINRQTIFEDDEDKSEMLSTLKYFAQEGKFKLYGYCIMDNHIHILMQEIDDEISISIQRICSSYVFWYNKKYERVGHLFQERFKSEVVDSDDYFTTVLRYIHQNPIKAGITKNVADFIWSSYSNYIGEADIIDVDFGLDLFSVDRTKAIDLFVKYHLENNDDICLDYDDYIKLTDDEAREAIRRLGVTEINKIQSLDKEDRDEVLRELKKIKGITIIQFSRITGISKSVIARA